MEKRYGMTLNIPASSRYEVIEKSIDYLRTIKERLQTEDLDMYIEQENGKSNVSLVFYQGLIDSIEEYNELVKESRKNKKAPSYRPLIELEEMEDFEGKEQVSRDEVYTYILMAEGNIENRFDKSSSMC